MPSPATATGFAVTSQSKSCARCRRLSDEHCRISRRYKPLYKPLYKPNTQ